MKVAIFVVHKEKGGVYRAKATGIPIEVDGNSLDDVLAFARQATVTHFWGHKEGDRCMISIIYSEEVT